MLFFLPSYFQEILGYTPTETGVLLLPLTGLMVVGSPLGGRIAARVGPRPPIVIGLTMMLIAIFWISTLDLSTTYSDLWAPTAIMGFGIGFSLTPMNLAAMNAVSRDHAGAASGILVTLSGLGATLGVAVTGAIFAELQTQKTVEFVGQSGGHGRPRPGPGARGGARRHAGRSTRARQARRAATHPVSSTPFARRSCRRSAPA